MSSELLKKLIGGGVSKLRAVPIQANEIEQDLVCHVAELTAEQRDELESEWSNYRDTFGDGESAIGFRAFCVAFCLCDSERNLLLVDRKTRNEYAEQLQGTSSRLISRLFSTAARINGLTRSDEEELGNSSKTQSDSGNGGSHSASATPAGRRGSRRSAVENTANCDASADSKPSDTND